LTENLNGTKLINLRSSQYVIICNGLMMWMKSNKMNCIHGPGISVVDYVISNIIVYNHIVSFDRLIDHESEFDQRPLTITLNFIMQEKPLEDNFGNQRNLLFCKNKVDLFLKDLNTELNPLSNKNNIEDIYHNFRTILSTSIKNSLSKCYVKRRIKMPTIGMITSVNFLENPLGMPIMSL
jgi:hypothetical protein